MAYVLPSETMQFLRDLSDNNSKEWMDANRKRYERELKKPARELVREINGIIGEIAPEWASDKPEKNLSRINRDIRFSKDKTPYNTHIWGGFGKKGSPKGVGAGLYFGISPTGWGVGAGTWKPSKEAAEALRATIAERHGELSAIVSEPAFAQHFGALGGDAYKRVPKPYPADHPAAEWLKLKSVHVRCDHEEPELICTEGFLPTLRTRLETLLPLLHFLDQGMAT